MTRRITDSLNKFHVSSFDNIDSFLARSIPNGVNVVNYGGSPLDILSIFSGAKDTLIVFHSSLSEKMQILPVFSGQQLAKVLNMNLISIADPSLVLDDALNLAWFLGNRNQPLIHDLPKIIDHIMESHQGARRIYFGASGGGFAALLYSRLISDSICVVANPRIDINARPRQDIGPYLRSCFGASGRTAAQRIIRNNIVMSLIPLYEERHSNHIVYIQNVRDRHYLNENMIPFVSSLSEDVLFDLFLGDFGAGHRPVPRNFIQEVISASIGSVPIRDGGLANIGFRNAPSLAEVNEAISEILAH